MTFRKLTLTGILFSYTIINGFLACNINSMPASSEHEMKRQLSTIDSLLRDTSFARTMAGHLDSAYYTGIGQTPPSFLAPEDDTATVTMSLKEEKIAINLAGFYALECGIGLLSSESGETFMAILRKVVDANAGSNEVFTLNRFANATWKAGQPFRGLNRITRPVFMIASNLSADEVKKDSVQIKNAAALLYSSMLSTAGDSIPQQMQRLRTLLQDTGYALQMAAFLDSAFATNQHQKVTPFISSADDTATIKKSTKEIKIATSLAGFYALECGLNYLITKTNKLPSEILSSLVHDSLSKDDQMIFARFANATWKAGQPFRGLKRISRATFTPFYFLSEADVNKDLVQVKAAAKKLLSVL